MDGNRIPIVDASAGFKILGTIFTLSGRTSAEFLARIAAGWGKLHQLWPLLGKRSSNLCKRLRIFDMSVSQTVLWCSESWLLTQNEKRILASTQNHMLRRIAGIARSPDEPWVHWLKRSTRQARMRAEEAGIRLWLPAHLMDPARLAHRATKWRDSEWQAEEQTFPTNLRIRRPRRNRWFRWKDELRRYASANGWQSWQAVANQREVWTAHCETFGKHVLK